VRGFTLIELLVTVGIFVLVSSLILANYPKFASRISLSRTAQEIALSLKKAQSFGLGVREFGAGSSIFPGYGVHFDLAADREYLIFADINANKSYDASSELVELFQIETSPRIISLCAGEKTQPPGDCSLTNLDITYLRPAPNIFFKGGVQISYSDVEVKIASPDGTTRTITVWTTGQISVE